MQTCISRYDSRGISGAFQYVFQEMIREVFQEVSQEVFQKVFQDACQEIIGEVFRKGFRKIGWLKKTLGKSGRFGISGNTFWSRSTGSRFGSISN